MINFHKFATLTLLFLSLSLGAMQQDYLGRFTGLTASGLKEVLLRLKSSPEARLELKLDNVVLDKNAFNLLLEVLQQPHKIVSLHFGPNCTIEGPWFTYEVAPSLANKTIYIESFSMSELSVESLLTSEIKRSIIALAPCLKKVKINQCPDNAQKIQNFISDLFHNANIIDSLDISDNKLNLAEVSRIISMLMQKKKFMLSYFVSKNNAADLPNDAYQKKLDVSSISQCWQKTFPQHFAPQLISLDMSGMRLSDKFAALLMGHFKNGWFPNLESIDLGIRDEQPTVTTKILQDIKASGKFYQLKSMQFNNAFISEICADFSCLKLDDQMPREVQPPAVLANTQVIISKRDLNALNMKLIVDFLSLMNNGHLTIDACTIDGASIEEVISIFKNASLDVLELKNIVNREFVDLIAKLHSEKKMPAIKILK